MARAPDARVDQAKELYQQGKKLVEISAQLGVPEGTVRRWKHTYGWDGERSGKKSERSKKKNERLERVKKAVAEEVGQVMENPDLNDKQRLFCLYYVRCFNATRAYIKAYGSDYRTAQSNGYQLLTKAHIRAEIQRLKQARLNRELLDESDIFQKYMDIAFADITDYVEFGREKVQVMGAFGRVSVLFWYRCSQASTRLAQVSTIRLKIFPPCGRRRRRTKISRCVWIRWWKRTTACSRSFTS